MAFVRPVFCREHKLSPQGLDAYQRLARESDPNIHLMGNYLYLSPSMFRKLEQMVPRTKVMKCFEFFGDSLSFPCETVSSQPWVWYRCYAHNLDETWVMQAEGKTKKEAIASAAMSVWHELTKHMAPTQPILGAPRLGAPPGQLKSVARLPAPRVARLPAPRRGKGPLPKPQQPGDHVLVQFWCRKECVNTLDSNGTVQLRLNGEYNGVTVDQCSIMAPDRKLKEICFGREPVKDIREMHQQMHQQIHQNIPQRIAEAPLIESLVSKIENEMKVPCQGQPRVGDAVSVATAGARTELNMVRGAPRFEARYHGDGQWYPAVPLRDDLTVVSFVGYDETQQCKHGEVRQIR